jgi:glycosyltransferase involved in cell wall biosynthesis
LIRVLLVPSSDYVGHPFPQRHNQIFERLNDDKRFEVHVVRFKLFDKLNLQTKLFVHELKGKKVKSVAPYYLINLINHGSQIRNIVRKEHIDVIVLSNLAAPFVYTLLEEISSLNIPLVFDLPDYYPTSAAGYLCDVRSTFGKVITGSLDFMLRRMIKNSCIVTVASKALEKYAKIAGCHNVIHVPNGIADFFFKSYQGSFLRKKFGYDEEDLIVGYIGTLEFWLDMENFLNGVVLAREKGLTIKIMIIGGKLYTGYSEKVKKWIKQRKLENDTEFLDFVPYREVPKHISGFDVGLIPFDVLNPTAYYSAPNKMWEYLSQKKAVISTPIPEVINNSDSLLIASTPEDYANKFLSVAENRAEVRQKIKTGYQKALNKTWDNSTKIFASTLSSLFP